jgi:hypothetical protein
MKSEPKIVRPFTPEEQAEFDRGITIDDIFARFEAKYNLVL